MSDKEKLEKALNFIKALAGPSADASAWENYLNHTDGRKKAQALLLEFNGKQEGSNIVTVKKTIRQPRAVQITGSNWEEVRKFRADLTGAALESIPSCISVTPNSWIVELIDDPDGRRWEILTDYWFKIKYEVL